jgi:hypothetical protein
VVFGLKLIRLGLEVLSLTVNADRLLFPEGGGGAALSTVMVYGFWLPFCAVTTILIVVLKPAARNGMVRACPEVVIGPGPFDVTVRVAVGSCSVGVTVTLLTLLPTFTV